MRDKFIDALNRFVQPPDDVPLEQVADLKQTSEIWECSARLARAWITPPDQAPYRPYIVMVASKAGRIRFSEIFEDQPSPAQIVSTLAKAMRYPIPGAGGKRRPGTIEMDDEALIEAVSPPLEQVNVRCKYRRNLPEIERALKSMGEFMETESPIAALLAVPGVNPFMIQGLFKSAASFYRAAPWRWIDDSRPIKVHYPLTSKARYAVVMGQGGQTYGLAVYDSTDILHQTYSGAPPEELIGRGSWVSLLFSEPIEMPFDDLDDIEAHDWPVAGDQAYPLFVKFTRSGQFTRPSKSDLLRMEALLLAIPRFVRGPMEADEGCLQRAEATLTVEMIDGEDEVRLSYPVPGFEKPFE